MKNQNRIKTLAYIALYVALYVVLKYVGNLIPLFEMPNGGSIELELVAVFLASYHLGWKTGMFVGLLSWLITWVLGFPMWFYWPIQIVLDYVLPLVLCGMASLLWPFKNLNKTWTAVMSAVLAVFAMYGILNCYGNQVPAYLGGTALAIAIFAFSYWYISTRKRFGIIVAMLLKFLCQTLSGVYYWFPEGSVAGSPAAWAYSLTYNIGYNLVTMIVCMFLVPLLIDRLEKANVKFIA